MKLDIRTVLQASGGAPYLRIQKPTGQLETTALNYSMTIDEEIYPAHIVELEAELVIYVEGLSETLIGTEVSGILDLGTFYVPRKLPGDLDQAMRDSGLDLELLSAAEIRQAVMFVNEATDPSIRRERIDAFLSSFREADKCPD